VAARRAAAGGLPVSRARAEAGRLGRYLGVGAVATLVHWGLLVVAVEALGWPAWLGSGVGAVAGAQVAYAGNRRLTFAHRGAIVRSWPRFQFTALAGAVLGMGIVALAVHWRLHYLVGQALATGTVALVTYVVNRHWTFGATPDRG
jgi:putative flippase GtrA